MDRLHWRANPNSPLPPGFHGHRSGSLSVPGAVAASVLGYATLANPLSTFGVLLLSFYFAGSKVTKVGAPLYSAPKRELTARLARFELPRSRQRTKPHWKLQNPTPCPLRQTRPSLPSPEGIAVPHKSAATP